MGATVPLARSGDTGPPLPRLVLDLRTYATAVAVASMAVGTIVLAGWWLGASFVQVSGGRTGMLPSTAISLALGGLSLALSTMRDPGRGARPAARALASLLVALALAGLAVVALDPQLQHLGSRYTETGLVPAANTSFAYLLVGLALLATSARVRFGWMRPTELLAGGAAVIALVALFGHVYGAASLYVATRSFRTVGMTATSALALFLLATGIFSIPSQSGLIATLTSPHAGGRLVRRILVGVVVVPILGLVITLGRTAGLYTQPEAAALLAVVAIVLGSAWIIGTARSLDRSDVERLRAEADAAKWRLFFEHAEWGAAIGGPEGRIELVNRAFAQQHGWREDAMTGMDVAGLFPADRQGDLEQVKAGLQEHKHVRMRSEHLRRDGTRFPVLIDASAIEDEAGRLLHRAVHVQDLTELERAEAHVARLAAIVESSDDAIFASDTDAVIVEWNAGAERLYGYRADEMIGRSALMLVPPERRAEGAESVARLLRRERVSPFETERLRKDGTRVWVSTSGAPIVLDGRLIGFSAIAHDITQRKSIEDALRRSEQRFRELLEGASDGIFVADLAGRYTDVNRAGCALLGYVREEIVGKTILDLIPPEEVARLAQSKDRLLSGDVHVAEWRLRRKDGSYVPVEVSAKIHPDGRWQGFVRDIRERKAIEEELRLAHENERRLRSEIELVMHAGGAVTEELAAIPSTGLPKLLHTIALQAQLLTGADAVAVAIGTDPERPFDAWATVGADPELERLVDRIPRARATLGRVAREGQVLRSAEIADDPAFAELPPGHRRLHAVLGVPIRHGGRSIGSLFLASARRAESFTDAHQRVIEMLAARVGPAIEIARAYGAEALQRAWLTAVLEQMPEGVVILDRDGKAVLHNPAARRLSRETGALDRWGNPAMYDVRDPHGVPIASEDLPLARAFTTGQSVIGVELALCLPDGELVPVLASATPVRSEDRVAGAVVVFQDIRALKQLERLREEWASVIAHDLRQPLNVISMATGVLLKRAGGVLGDTDRRLLDRVMLATRSISRMVEDLLDASRIEARRLTLARAEHEVCAVVRDVVERNQVVIGDQEVVVRCGGEAVVSLDPGRIEQVLVNLLSNAKKYGDPGAPIEIDIALHEADVEVAVTNHGPGIPPEEIESLFQRFSRARDAATGKVVGIGLGLYICRGIVEAHGGVIRAESTPGATTTFRFTLPRAR